MIPSTIHSQEFSYAPAKVYISVTYIRYNRVSNIWYNIEVRNFGQSGAVFHRVTYQALGHLVLNHSNVPSISGQRGALTCSNKLMQSRTPEYHIGFGVHMCSWVNIRIWWWKVSQTWRGKRSRLRQLHLLLSSVDIRGIILRMCSLPDWCHQFN